jgi:hypothetical protein
VSALYFPAGPPPKPDPSKPGTHALVVGVGDYAHLPDDDGTDAPPAGARAELFGLKKLNSAARGAFRVAEWLVRNAAELNPPLVSLRLLLSPTAAEKAGTPALAALNQPVPTRAAFADAVEAWRAAAHARADNATFFYFAGHGLLRKVGDHVLLLNDFGADKQFLGGAVSTAHLLDGMRAMASWANPAGNQLYLFDACKVRPDLFSKYEDSMPGFLWERELVKDETRQLAVLYSTQPGRLAYGDPNGNSLFCDALIECLDSAAVVPPKKTRSRNPYPCTVTARSLLDTIGAVVARRAAAHGHVQEVDGVPRGNFVIRTFTHPPKVPVHVELNPSRARHRVGLRMRLKDRPDVAEFVVAPLVLENPHVGDVEVGYYDYVAEDPTRPPGFTSDGGIVQVSPPQVDLVLDCPPC